MSKYDFSKITTEELQNSVDYTEKSTDDLPCSDIPCRRCPLKGMGCVDRTRPERTRLIKEELDRRLGKPTIKPMPELKSGMFVELDHSEVRMVINGTATSEGLVAMDKKGYYYECDLITKLISDARITKVFEMSSYSNYWSFFEGTNGRLYEIWARQSEAELKKAELLKTIEELKQQVEELES